MANELSVKAVRCPYCGETIEILVDSSVPEQAYIEDCQVCCQPINFSVTVFGPENISVQVSSDNE